MAVHHSEAEICLGTFGDVRKMTAETVEFLIHVLEKRKQELLDSSKDNNVGRRMDCVIEEKDDVLEKGQDNSVASEVACLQLNLTSDSDAHVTELVRSHSYEALVQLERMLEERHNKIMNNDILDLIDDRQLKRVKNLH